MSLKILTFIWNFIFWTVVSIVILFSVLSGVSQQKNSTLPFSTYIVQSGSMEPTIMTGDLIFVRRNRGFANKDIITFHDPQGHTITHRIIKTEKQPNGTMEFITKGDNNEDEDQYTTPPKSVLGVHWFTIPKLGYILVYTRSFLGIVTALSLLAGWIVAEKVWHRLNTK